MACSSPKLIILDEVFIASPMDIKKIEELEITAFRMLTMLHLPKRQYRGILLPTIPATTIPECDGPVEDFEI